VTQICLSRPADLFVAIKPQRGICEIETGETANAEVKRKRRRKSELFESLAFLVTFLAMKKVTKVLRATKSPSYNGFGD